MERKYISNNSLNRWLSFIYDEYKCLYAPVVEATGKSSFKPVQSVDEISWNHIQTTQSPKNVAFPRVEKLFSYQKKQGDITIQEADNAAPQAVVFGLHPCDAKGFEPLAAILNRDTRDKPFNERRQRLTLISLACTRSDEYCFCTSVGGSPDSAEGSDILLIPVNNEGYLVEIITEQGKLLIDKHLQLFEPAPNVDKKAVVAKVPARFDIKELQQKIGKMFDSELWKKQSARCIGCGACAFVCPDCVCFDIQENAKGNCGERLRCWDSCCFAQFTLHTSGHNPRPTQSARWRQRLMHKFSYMPERLSVTGCTGCGRCSRACPADMNLAEHLGQIDN
jgi:ferredoxin